MISMGHDPLGDTEGEAVLTLDIGSQAKVILSREPPFYVN